MKQVVIYTKDYCPYCVRAKQLLEKRGIAFKEINIGNDQPAMQKLIERTKMKTVPQIFFGEKLIGGSDELHQLDKQVDLLSLLAES